MSTTFRDSDGSSYLREDAVKPSRLASEHRYDQKRYIASLMYWTATTPGGSTDARTTKTYELLTNCSARWGGQRPWPFTFREEEL